MASHQLKGERKRGEEDNAQADFTEEGLEEPLAVLGTLKDEVLGAMKDALIRETRSFVQAEILGPALIASSEGVARSCHALQCGRVSCADVGELVVRDQEIRVGL